MKKYFICPFKLEVGSDDEEDDLDDAEALARKAKRPKMENGEIALPLEDIYLALYDTPAPKPNQATKDIHVEDSSTVYRIDQIAQEICRTIIQTVNTPNWVPGTFNFKQYFLDAVVIATVTCLFLYYKYFY